MQSLLTLCVRSYSPVTVSDVCVAGDDDDWVTIYHKRLPARSTMVGKCKGRSVKGLRDRVAALLKSKGTRSQALLLQAYHDIIKTCVELRGGIIIPTLTDDQLRLKLEEVMPEVKLLPADVSQHLLERRKERLIAARRWSELVLALALWTGSGHVFDWAAPTMGTLPRVLQWKIEVYRQCMFEHLVCALIFDGADTLPQVKAISEQAIVVLEEEDVLSISGTPACASVFADSLCTFRALLAITTLPFESSYEADLQEMVDAQTLPLATQIKTIPEACNHSSAS